MQILRIPGGYYCDALPSGEFAVLMPGEVLTHLGPVPLPAGQFGLLFIRCTNVGGFRFAGQAHDGNGGYEWSPTGGWRIIPPPLSGENPLIYDQAGLLHSELIPSGGSFSSQGFRYVAADGTLVTGDATYYDPATGLSEWSEYQGLRVGQGHDVGGVVVYDGAMQRQLAAGDCRFVRLNGAGSWVTVAYATPTAAIITQATLDELRALPPVVTPVPVPVPVPVPAPVPVPVPEPPPVSTPGSSADNPRVTSPLDAASLDAAIAASWAGTHNSPIPDGDKTYWRGLASVPQQYSDGVWRIGWNRYWEARMAPGNTGSADPAWGDLAASYQPGTAPAPAPTPPPAPQPDQQPVPAPAGFDDAAILAAVANLQATVQRCSQNQIDVLNGIKASLQASANDLKAALAGGAGTSLLSLLTKKSA